MRALQVAFTPAVPLSCFYMLSLGTSHIIQAVQLGTRQAKAESVRPPSRPCPIHISLSQREAWVDLLDHAQWRTLLQLGSTAVCVGALAAKHK